MDRQTDQHTDQQTTTKHQLFINGEWTDAAAKGTYEKANPFNGKPASTVAAGKREDTKRAIEAAAAAFPTWSNTAPAVRRKLLLKAADVLDAHQADIARITAEETGETFGWGIFNCIFASGRTGQGRAGNICGTRRRRSLGDDVHPLSKSLSHRHESSLLHYVFHSRRTRHHDRARGRDHPSGRRTRPGRPGVPRHA